MCCRSKDADSLLAINKNPFGFRQFAHQCGCTNPNCDKERMLHEFGDLSFALPLPANRDDEAEVEAVKALVMYMLKKLNVASYDRPAVWEYHVGVCGPAHISVHHFHECDVRFFFEANGRRRATLELLSKHPDVLQAGRGGKGQKYKQPMPNRPQKGAGLDDGIETGKYRWTGPNYIDHQPAVAVGAGMQPPPQPHPAIADSASILLGRTPQPAKAPSPISDQNVRLSDQNVAASAC